MFSSKPTLSSHKSLQLIDTSVLVVVDPSHCIEGTNVAHVFRKPLSLGPGEVVNDWDDVAVILQGTNNLLVHPVLAVGVVEAAVEGVGGEHQQEVPRLPDGAEQVVVELARLEPLHVDERAEPAQLHVHL